MEIREHRRTVAELANTIRDTRLSSSSLSELLLLTLFFGANAAVILSSRQNTFQGDASAYLITVISLLVLGVSWRYYREIFSPVRAESIKTKTGGSRYRTIVRQSPLRFRLFSHATLILAFVILYALIYFDAPPQDAAN